MSKPENPPFFPVSERVGKIQRIAGDVTLRDYFAGQVLTGLMSQVIDDNVSPQLIAQCAYITADSMLATREPIEGDA